MNIFISILTIILSIASISLLFFAIDLICDSEFLKRNYKEINFGDCVPISFEKFERIYRLICSLYNFRTGQFKIVDFNSNYCVITIKNKYFLCDGNNLKFLYTKEEIIQDKLALTFMNYCENKGFVEKNVLENRLENIG